MDLVTKIILKQAVYQVAQHDCRISNIDSVIISQVPKLSICIQEMHLFISEILEIHHNAIGIKSKTNVAYVG